MPILGQEHKQRIVNIISAPTLFLLSLSMLKGVGPAALKKVASIPSFSDIGIEELGREVSQVGRALANIHDWQKAQSDAAQQVNEAEKHNARILSPIDFEYPQLLAATKDDPFILYVQGTLAKNPLKSVAIIGTREPTTHGKLITQRIAQFFSEQEWSIVSGLAIGCDGLAHQTAVDAGAHTVAVMAHGLQMIAPARHRKLAKQILDAGGALVSEYPFGQNVQGQQYVKRDRTQAGMAQGVVMIQSDLKGGSLYASRASLDYGRWLAVPYPTDKDLEHGEPKVQANLIIADGSDSEKLDLLRCHSSALGKIIILRGRDDYLRMIESVGSTTTVASKLDTVVKAPIRPTVNNDVPQVQKPNKHPDTLTVRYTPRAIGTLKATQIPAPTPIEFEHVGSVYQNVDVLNSLAMRLRYLQRQLDTINLLSRSSQLVGNEEDTSFLRFSIEGALTQIVRIVDGLAELNPFDATPSNPTVNGPSIKQEASSQLGLLEPNPQLELKVVSAIAMLERLSNASRPLVKLNLPAYAQDEYSKGVPVIASEAGMDFDEVINSLNKLIEMTLHLGPSDSPMTL